MYQDESHQEEKERISLAFASIENEDLLQEVLAFAQSVSEELISKIYYCGAIVM